MRTVVQDQAFNMRCALVDSYSAAKVRKGMVTITLKEGDVNLIDHLLERVAVGELVEKPAPVASYVQHSMLADDAGAPLFSMAQAQP
jgi:hypothetical protein